MKERITAKQSVDYLLKKKNATIEEIGLSPLTIVSWFPHIIKILAKKTNATLINKKVFSHTTIYKTNIQGKDISFAILPIGAPATILTMETFIVCGVNTFIGIGYAGSLQPNVKAGSIVIPTECISKEGTSDHYLKNKATTKIIPSTKLVNLIQNTFYEKNIPIHTGHHWTTDAIYREYIEDIMDYQKKGIISVDMETSAMYTLGMIKKLDICNILVISDELWEEWNPMFISNEINKSVNIVIDMIYELILKL